MAEENRFRNREVRVKLSEEEYAIVVQKSHEADMSISDAIRSLIVYGTINAKWLDDASKNIMISTNENIRELINAINKIGVNLNQIAYCTNVIGDSNDEVVEEALLHTRNIGQLLIDAYRELRDLCDANSSHS